jgi:hypothetical protein
MRNDSNGATTIRNENEDGERKSLTGKPKRGSIVISPAIMEKIAPTERKSGPTGRMRSDTEKRRDEVSRCWEEATGPIGEGKTSSGPTGKSGEEKDMAGGKSMAGNREVALGISRKGRGRNMRDVSDQWTTTGNGKSLSAPSESSGEEKDMAAGNGMKPRENAVLSGVAKNGRPCGSSVNRKSDGCVDLTLAGGQKGTGGQMIGSTRRSVIG